MSPSPPGRQLPLSGAAIARFDYQQPMALRLLSNRALRAFILPRRGLDEFVTGSSAPAKAKDASKKDEKDVDASAAGRPWKAAELRRMNFNQLHELWWVLLKERNHLLTMRDWARAQRANIPNPHRIIKVKQSMARIKTVLTEREMLGGDSERGPAPVDNAEVGAEAPSSGVSSQSVA